MNPDNPVVDLCSQGMRAEAEGRPADARDLFRQAWERATDDYEACVAAHYLARHQPTPELTLHWNQECPHRANLVGDDRVKGFHTSLHVNLAKAYTDLGEPGKARGHYERAARRLTDVPPGQYADWNRVAIAEGLRSTGAIEPRPADALVRTLLGRLCERADLKALALILPACLADLGTGEDGTRLATALHMLHAARWLLEDEQHTPPPGCSATAPRT
ncbi:tetratricopeptide (TPR) repeat protein [Nonomuraea thailandensis]|uniref:Tetratricopeptide (TPR) repeat protein n=1 Tax=Nonomuraea thailandensis TaxID=1188745 RepID=A0A9X2K013_9ACTN|nr:hypothetical protein [Nonomuraea thailandensis]MCP2355852.1 tetratricopeptide (TPR) repeat protein [Nonomuraea thailandensis]